MLKTWLLVLSLAGAPVLGETRVFPQVLLDGDGSSVLYVHNPSEEDWVFSLRLETEHAWLLGIGGWEIPALGNQGFMFTIHPHVSLKFSFSSEDKTVFGAPLFLEAKSFGQASLVSGGRQYSWQTLAKDTTVLVTEDSAIALAGDNSETIELRLHDLSGNFLEARTVVVDKHMALYLSELFEAKDYSLGSLRVRSKGPVALTVLIAR